MAAIVPAYNEEATVGDVVRALKAAPSVDEVIVVSDGSTDGTVMAARKAGARVIEIKENVGKGQAMLAGVAATSAEVVAFFDADLIGLTSVHVEALAKSVLSGTKMMNVALRDRGVWLTRLTRHLPLISGIRVMRREVIEGVNPKYLKGFMVESALNYTCRTHGYRYGTKILRGIQIRHKYEKVGKGRAVLQYAKMFWEVFKAVIVVRGAHFMGKF